MTNWLPEWINSWADVLRIIVLLQGCWQLGGSAFVVYIYLVKHPNLKLFGPRIRCIFSFALGNAIMTFLLLRAVYIGVFGHPYIHWPYAIVFLLLAFTLIDYGLYQFIELIRTNQST